MLTTTQVQTVKADILANADLSVFPNDSDGNAKIAQLYNKPAAVDYIVWKTSVSMDEIMRNAMDWSRVDNLSVGKARIWEWLGNLGVINPSLSTVRSGIDATWVGTAADLAVRAAVYVYCKRKATRAEKLLAAGLGTDVSPSVMGFEGMLSGDDVDAARRA